METSITLEKVLRLAKERMQGTCRVCSRCNGKVCAGEVPGMGGLGTGQTFKNNVNAWDELCLNMRLVHGVTHPSMACEVLGLSLALPLLAAPVAGVGINMGGHCSEEAYIAAYVAGCKASGIIGCVGDSAPDMIYEAGLQAVTANGGWGIPFFKPWEADEAFRKFKAARQAGASVVGVDIDAAGLITMRKLGRPVAPKTFEQIKAFADCAHAEGLKFVLKGLMTCDDALCAIHAGVDGIVVSNHGGRVLDHTPGTAQVLPAIVRVAKGRIAVLVDGGLRTGADILKALALGADAVMIGRPFAVATLGGEAEGVALYVQTLRAQLEQAMILTGCACVREAGSHLLWTR